MRTWIALLAMPLTACSASYDFPSTDVAPTGIADQRHDDTGLTTPLLSWKPNLDQPIQQLEEILAVIEQQQPRNYTISNIAFLLDAKLYILFRNYADRLSEDQLAKELSEQGEWLRIRKNLIDVAYTDYEEGTLASQVAAEASVKATQDRIQAIEQKLRSCEEEGQ